MQAGTGVRPHFSCTVCHTVYDGLFEFKHHLESQEHELAYGIRLRNSMVGSYFCNCCHICVNTLLIWKSHIMGTKHMKIACAFSMAYSNFDFDKPAKIKDVGVLDQNVVVPDSLQRSNGRPSTLVRPLDSDTIVIGVTDMQYNGPGLYHCDLCDEPFNEGNKAQHLGSTRHRCNVFRRWDMALYEEAMSVKEVGKPEFTARCESIASEIFPVEQQVLSSDKKLLYERIMGTNQILDDQYYVEELARGGAVPKGDSRQSPYDSQGPRGSRDYDRQVQQDRYGPPDDNTARPRYHDNQYSRDGYPENRHPQGRLGQREAGRQRGGRGRRAQDQDDHFYPRNQGRYQDYPRGYNNQPPQPPRQVAVDSDIKCDLAMESVRVLLQNLNIFVSETRSTPFTRVEILKAQILYEEVLKMAYPDTQKAHADENYITVFHNGRLTLKRKEEPVKKAVPPVKVEERAAAVEPKPPEPLRLAEEPSTSDRSNRSSSKERRPADRSSSKERGQADRSSSKERRPADRSSSKERRPADRSSSKERRIADRSSSRERRPLDRSSSREFSDRRPPSSRHGQPGPHGVPSIPHQSVGPMFDPWGRPIMMHPGDVHRIPFYPPPDYYGHGGYPRPDEVSRDSRDRPGSPRRISSPPPARKRTPPPGLENSRDQKKPRSKTPERVVTLKEGSPIKSRPRSKSPRRTPGRRSPGRRSPRKSPPRSSRKSPSRRSPGRKSSSRRPSPPRRQSPRRQSPRRQSPRRRSPTTRKSPSRRGRSPPTRRSNEKQEDGDGTLFLDEGAYAELLESLG